MYQVGQILFAVSDKSHQVFPVMVVEQVVRRNLKGESISYRVQVPGKKEFYDLDTLDVGVFPDLGSVRKSMQETIVKRIEKILQQASEMAGKAFGHDASVDFVHVASPADLISEVAHIDTDQSAMKITLDDGTVANVTLPTDIPTPGPSE